MEHLFVNILMREVITVTLILQTRKLRHGDVTKVGTGWRVWARKCDSGICSLLPSSPLLSGGPRAGFSHWISLWKCCLVHVQGQIVRMWVFTPLLLKSCRKFCVFTAQASIKHQCVSSRFPGEEERKLSGCCLWQPECRGRGMVQNGDGGAAPHSLL